MRLKGFDLNLLPILYVLLAERSIVRAAERVGLSQPGMSAALQRLRQYFGDPLLIPNGRSLELSSQGVALLEPVREALQRVDGVFEAQPAFSPRALKREFRIVMADFLIAAVLPSILTQIAVSAPGVLLHVEPVTGASVRRLTAGEVDLCFWPYEPRLFHLEALPDTVRRKVLGPAPWICIAASDWLDLPEALSLAHFLALKQVVSRPSLVAENVEPLWERLLGVPIQIVATTTSMVDLPTLVAATSLATTIPATMLPYIPRNLNLTHRSVLLPVPCPEESILWHSRNDMDIGHRWLRTLLMKARREGRGGGRSPADVRQAMAN